MLTRLLCSSRSHEEIIYRKELERVTTKDGSLEVFRTLTRSRPEGWDGCDRRIDTEMLEEVGPPPGEQPLIFVSGPTPLVEAVATTLVKLGYAPTRVKTERFGPTGG